MPASALAEPLMTTAEVAAYLRVPVATIHQWRYRSEGPRAAKVGRHLRFRKADVDAWLEQQSTEAA
jgi:excisionase family DNA binding protein